MHTFIVYVFISHTIYVFNYAQKLCAAPMLAKYYAPGCARLPCVLQKYILFNFKKLNYSMPSLNQFVFRQKTARSYIYIYIYM